MSFIKNFSRLEKLKCIDICKSEGVAYDLKNVTLNIRGTNFFIETKYWKGEDFYCYDINYIKIYNKKTDFGVSSREPERWSIEDCLKEMPEDAQVEILMNLDLFMEIK